MKQLLLIATILFSINFVAAQDGGCSVRPGDSYSASRQKNLKTQTDLPSEVIKAFPTAAKLVGEKPLQEVRDKKNALVGFAYYSKPASNGIQGFGGETPLMIALDPQRNVVAVVMLENSESPEFAGRVMQSGLLNSWNGLSARKARKKSVDAVSGATYTSTSVIQTFRAAMRKLEKMK